MPIEMLSQNLISAPILFFITGCLARLVKSDLEIPSPLPKLFSLFLLTAIGLKGGIELRNAGISSEIVLPLFASFLMSLLTPVWVYAIFRRKIDASNAAALAATYGSVSAVTFITATGFLQSINIPYGGHLVAALAIMEAPAIVVGVFLARKNGSETANDSGIKQMLHEACFNGSVFLLLSALCMGMVLGKERAAEVQPFFGSLFKGILCMFLLDMGMVAMKRVRDLITRSWFILLAAIAVPLLNAGIGIGISWILGMPKGDALLFTVLCASASYIAVPAALNTALPSANPSIYVSMALALTFPFNVLIGIPLYMQLIQAVWRA